jgi:hypothetical protein
MRIFWPLSVTVTWYRRPLKGQSKWNRRFPVTSPYIFLNEALRVGKARNDIGEVDAVLSHIALPLHFIPFKLHNLLYVQSVCIVKYSHKSYGRVPGDHQIPGGSRRRGLFLR